MVGAGSTRRRQLVGWLLLLGLIVAIRLWVAHPERVGGDSMSPTLHPGDVVLTVRAGLLRSLDPLQRGDLVTFDDPQGPGRVVKRVVGLAADQVSIEDAVLVVNGRPVVERYVDSASIDGVYYGPVSVPAGQLLAMGDNRAASVDSRQFGPVSQDALTGRVVLRLWPWWR